MGLAIAKTTAFVPRLSPFKLISTVSIGIRTYTWLSVRLFFFTTLLITRYPNDRKNFAGCLNGTCGRNAQGLKELPSIQRADVTVLHVVPATVGHDSQVGKGGNILATAMQSLNLDPSHVSSILRQGEPKDVVCQVADEINADLIIMGSRGLKRLQSILSNSVSQYVFQLSSRPMLLVKDDLYVKKINRIMVAMDSSEAAIQCLQLALFLLRDTKGSELILVHVKI